MKAWWLLVRHVVRPIALYFCCLYFLSLKITSNLKMGLNLNLIWQICHKDSTCFTQQQSMLQSFKLTILLGCADRSICRVTGFYRYWETLVGDWHIFHNQEYPHSVAATNIPSQDPERHWSQYSPKLGHKQTKCWHLCQIIFSEREGEPELDWVGPETKN